MLSIFFKKKIFIYFNRCIENFFGSRKSKDKFVIFAQKLATREILTLVSKVSELSAIFETTVDVVFVRNIMGGR